MSARFDILYHEHGPSIDYHFCRSWDEDGGCYGTRDDHGLSFDDACEEMAKWHEQEAAAWRDRTHHKIAQFEQL